LRLVRTDPITNSLDKSNKSSGATALQGLGR